MRIFALSDLHLDFEENARWLAALSLSDYRADALICAGDLSEDLRLLTVGFRSLTARFRTVLYVPGNHELWLTHADGCDSSFDKFARIGALASDHGVCTTPLREGQVVIVPLFGWYDYTFGVPSADLHARWADFHACRWPADATPRDITEHFLALNVPALSTQSGTVISFSHFLPRLDVMPRQCVGDRRFLDPVLGTTRLEQQVRELHSAIHVYGHSHVNHRVRVDGTLYINNAFGYPHETRTTSKTLRCVLDDTERPTPGCERPT